MPRTKGGQASGRVHCVMYTSPYENRTVLNCICESGRFWNLGCAFGVGWLGFGVFVACFVRVVFVRGRWTKWVVFGFGASNVCFLPVVWCKLCVGRAVRNAVFRGPAVGAVGRGGREGEKYIRSIY